MAFYAPEFYVYDVYGYCTYEWYDAALPPVDNDVTGAFDVPGSWQGEVATVGASGSLLVRYGAVVQFTALVDDGFVVDGWGVWGEDGEYVLHYKGEGRFTFEYVVTEDIDAFIRFAESSICKITPFVSSAGFITQPMIATGEDHALALHSDGTVWAWGRNRIGQLGDGTIIRRTEPKQVQNIDNMVAIAAGSASSVALRNDGTVWTWGMRRGNGTQGDLRIPTQVQSLTNIIAISTGLRHTMALRYDGTVWTWGSNQSGLLGDGTRDSRSTPVQVLDLYNITAIAAGGNHSVALCSDGTVWTWGSNFHGQLGTDSVPFAGISTPVQILSNTIAIAAGYDHTIALQDNGTVMIWGDNMLGQLGFEGAGRTSAPSLVPNLFNVNAISGGGNRTVVMQDGGNAYWWGQSSTVGNWTVTRNPVPTPVENITNAIAISAGSYHVIALKNDGSVWAWGDNFDGILGDGTTIHSNTPVQVLGPGGIGYFNLFGNVPNQQPGQPGQPEQPRPPTVDISGFSQPARDMYAMIRRTNGSRPFSNYVNPNDHNLIREAQRTMTIQPESGASLPLFDRWPAWISHSDRVYHYYQALRAVLMKDESLNLIRSYDASAEQHDRLFRLLIGSIPFLNASYTGHTFHTELRSVGSNHNFPANIELLALLYWNTDNSYLEEAIAHMLNNYYGGYVQYIRWNLYHNYLRDSELLYLTTPGIPIPVVSTASKVVSVVTKAYDYSFSALHTQTAAAHKILAFQAIRESVWGAYSEITQSVFSGQFTESDLLDALYLFELSSFLAEMQLWWMRPMLDTTIWGSLRLSDYRRTWDRHTIIQEPLREIVAMGGNPHFYPYTHGSRGRLSGMFTRNHNFPVQNIATEIREQVSAEYIYLFWLDGTFEFREIRTTTTWHIFLGDTPQWPPIRKGGIFPPPQDQIGTTVSYSSVSGVYEINTAGTRATLFFDNGFNVAATVDPINNIVRDDFGIHRRQSTTRLISVLCPVDVVVINDLGVIVGQIINNVPIYNDDYMGNLLLAADGDSKFIYLPMDSSYTILLKATGSGTMDFIVEDICRYTWSTTTSKHFQNVYLTPGRQMISNVAVHTPNIQLFLMSDGEIIGEILTNGTETLFNNQANPPTGTTPPSNNNESNDTTSTPSSPSTTTRQPSTPSTTPRLTITATGNVSVPATQTNNTITLSPTNANTTAILRAATDTVYFNLTAIQNTTTVTLPRTAWQQFINAGHSIKFILHDTTIILDNATARDMYQQSTGNTISIPLTTPDEETPPPAINLPSNAPPPPVPVEIMRLTIGSTTFTHMGTTMQNDVAPFIDAANNRTMVPLRIIADALDAPVRFNEATRTVFITHTTGREISLPIGAQLPGNMGAPVIISDRTFVPVRYVAEILGAMVRWDYVNQAVYVYR